MRQFTETELVHLKKTFDLYNYKGRGFVKQKHLSKLLRALGQSPTEAEMQSLIAELDPNDFGKLDFTDFVWLMCHHVNEFQRDDLALMEAFRVFDTTNCGYISDCDVKKIISKRGDGLEPNEIDIFIRLADRHRTGKFDYVKFVEFMAETYENWQNYM